MDENRDELAELLLRWEELREQGREASAAELTADCPHLAAELARRIEILKSATWLDDTTDGSETQGGDPPPPALSRRVLAGRYRIDEPIGSGGFSDVYRGYDVELQRNVAVKVPRGGRVVNPDAFLAEARRVARLKHPGLVPVHDVGRDGDVCFIVSEFVEGGTLAERLASRRPSPDQAIRWVLDVADALEYAHVHGVIHRDIKPANILIDHHGRALLADFGIAESPARTAAGAPSLGTLRYMSPEQLEGRGDQRSDVYSLGVVLHEALTGQLPYYSAGEPHRLRREILDGATVRLPVELRHVDPVCRRALKRQPHLRPASAAMFAADLRRAAAGQRAGLRPWQVAMLCGCCAAVAAVAVSAWNQLAGGRMQVSGFPGPSSLPAEMPSEWRRPGVLAEINGAGKIEFARLPTSVYVLDFDLEIREPQGRITIYSGEPGSGVDIPLGRLWDQDAKQWKIPCRLFRSQPFGVNWIGETHFRPRTRMNLTLVVADDRKALVRNGVVVLGSSGDAADCRLSLTATEDADATIHQLTCRTLSEADTKVTGLAPPPRLIPGGPMVAAARIAAAAGSIALAMPVPGEPHAIGSPPMPLRWIEPGEFTMGSADAAFVQTGKGREQVRISRGYWIGQHEVTQGLWMEVTGTNPSRITGSPFLPVNHVSWSEACQFCRRLTERERAAGRCPDSYVYRLPSEAEWEFACRAGTDAEWPVPLAELAAPGGRHQQLVEVGLTPANAWGLHEMQGNVPEWCLDEWKPYPERQDEATVDRLHRGDPARTMFVVRGNGVWETEIGPTSIARTRRHDIAGGFRGLRLVLGPEFDDR
jgi:formylglycine-generating enzyme required for sulfatase activity